MQTRSQSLIARTFDRAQAGRALLGCALLLCSACSSNKRGSEMGGVVGTGSGTEAGVRRAVHDAGSVTDAGGYAHTIYSGDRYLCGYDAQDMLSTAGNAQYPEVAVATDETGFALVHHDEAGSLFIEAAPVDGKAQDAVALLDASAGAQSVALAASGSHFLLAWRAGSDSSVRLNARELSSADNPVRVLTDKLVLSTNGGELSALLALDDGFIVAFIEQASPDNVLRLQRFSANGATMGAAVTVAGVGARAPEDLHIARLDSGGVLLAWLERDAQAQGHVMARVLAADLTTAGDPIMLSKNGVYDARFDLAARRQSEGLIYHAKDGDVRDAIKYRRVDEDGLAMQAVLNVVNAPSNVRDGSIAAFGQGYAVAFRELPSLAADHPSIHIAFVNQFGEVVHQAELDATTESGGRTTVAATADGHLMVGWTTEPTGSAETHSLKLYCPGALQLCGGTIKN